MRDGDGRQLRRSVKHQCERTTIRLTKKSICTQSFRMFAMGGLSSSCGGSFKCHEGMQSRSETANFSAATHRKAEGEWKTPWVLRVNLRNYYSTLWRASQSCKLFMSLAYLTSIDPKNGRLRFRYGLGAVLFLKTGLRAGEALARQRIKGDGGRHAHLDADDLCLVDAGDDAQSAEVGHRDDGVVAGDQVAHICTN